MSIKERMNPYADTRVGNPAIFESHPAAQPAPTVQEPVGEVVVESMGVRGSDAMRVRMHFYKEIPPVGSKIYTTPPAAPVPLTADQREEIAKGWRGRIWTVGDIIDATEAAHKITKGGAA
jgi:hypothetical protein